MIDSTAGSGAGSGSGSSDEEGVSEVTGVSEVGVSEVVGASVVGATEEVELHAAKLAINNGRIAALIILFFIITSV